MIGRGDDGRLQQFYDKYWEVCELVGVSLQKPQDASQDKAFGPTTCGSMLGIWFDSVKWIWYVSEEKVLRYCNDLSDMLDMETVTQREVWE